MNINDLPNDSKPNAILSNESKSQTHHFLANNKYFIISTYALAVIIISAFFIRIIFYFDDFSNTISNFLDAALPFIIAFFIAYFLNPIVKLVDRYFLKKLCKLKSKKLRVVLSIFISYLVLITLLVLLLTYVIPEIYNSLTDLASKLPNYFENLYSSANSFFISIEDKFPQLDVSYFKSKVEGYLPQLFKKSSDLIGSALTNTFSIISSTISTVYSILISIIISTYMIADRHVLAKNASKLTYAIFSKKNADMICKTGSECNTIFYNFVIGKALDSLIIGIITFVSMSIFDLDYPMMISIVVGITNMIPYFGPFIGAIPGVIILLIVSPVKALIFAILILAIQQFDGLYLGPKILGDSVGLSPLWIIFGITLGGSYLGVIGMFLGVPIVAVVAHLLDKLISYQLNKKKISTAAFSSYDEDDGITTSLGEHKVKIPKKISFFTFSRKK